MVMRRAAENRTATVLGGLVLHFVSTFEFTELSSRSFTAHFHLRRHFFSADRKMRNKRWI
jgi:hypothetical protein